MALAATAELRGVGAEATRYYQTVWQTDHSYVSAAFGLARQRARAGDVVGAISALDEVAPASASFTTAAATAIEVLLRGGDPRALNEQMLIEAGDRAASLNMESTAKRATMRLQVLGAALEWMRAGNSPRSPRLLGHDFHEPGVRTEMENCYRELAHDTSDTWERIDLVEKANAVRPRTRV
jgi:serine/threonine-protein kinase PknG